MKIVSCFLLAAVAAISANAASTDECSFACPDVMRPVCGSDGKTYSNKCYLSLASCQSKDSITTASDGECASTPQTTTAAPTSSANGSSSGTTDSGNCDFACLDVYDPVTDENGKEYSNACYMRLAKCQDKSSGAATPAPGDITTNV